MRRADAWVAIGLAAAVAAPAGSVVASPGADDADGRAVFTGAATAHASSLWLNPAALAQGRGATGPHFYLGGIGTIDQIAIDRLVIDPDTGAQSTGPSVGATPTDFGWTLAFWQTSASRNLIAGLVLASPQPATRFASGEPAIDYHTEGGGHRSTTLAAIGAAARVVSRVYIGGVLSLVRTRVGLHYARDTALEAGRDAIRGIASDCGGAPCGFENPLAAEHYRIEAIPDSPVATDNLSYAASAMIEIYPEWWIGATYELARTGVTLEGEAFVDRAIRDGGGTLEADAIVKLDLPSALDAELRGPIWPGLDLHVGLHYEDLSRFDGYDVRLLGLPSEFPDWTLRPRGGRDFVRAWGGVEQIDDGQIVLGGARVGFKTPEVDAARMSPTSIAGWSASADIGGQVRLGEGSNWIVQLGYGVDFYPTVDASDSEFDPIARLDCIDSGYDYSTEACERVRFGYAIPTAAGSYRRIHHAFRLGVRYDLP
jgi:hypothetical protein